MKDIYMQLPYDLSGSITKNRFRNEVLWGLYKFLEVYRNNQDFTMVFDYRCDIEVHFNDTCEFYQVKTQNDNGSFTVDKMIHTTPNSKRSILGKLFSLRFFDIDGKIIDNNFKLGLVSNAPLNDSTKTFNSTPVISLMDIDSSAIEKIKSKLKKELDFSNINLNNVCFVRTTMDLTEPHNTLKGALSTFFEEVFDSEIKKLNSLYKTLESKIHTIACYEKNIDDYDIIMEKKGFSKKQFDLILTKHTETADIAIEKSKKFIEENYNSFKRKVDLNNSLTSIFIGLKENKRLHQIELEMKDYILDNIDALPDTELEIISKVFNHFIGEKPIEISANELTALIILVLNRIGENVYE